MSMYGKYPKIQDEDGNWVEQRPWPATDFRSDKGFTVQADREDADINKIISRFQKTGQLPPSRRGEPFYGDVSDLRDLQDALIKIQEADELFMSYPAELRERFDNDPVKFVDFMSDEKNRPAAEELGLVVKAKPDIKPAAPAVPQPVAPAVSPE